MPVVSLLGVVPVTSEEGEIPVMPGLIVVPVMAVKFVCPHYSPSRISTTKKHKAYSAHLVLHHACHIGGDTGYKGYITSAVGICEKMGYELLIHDE